METLSFKPIEWEEPARPAPGPKVIVYRVEDPHGLGPYNMSAQASHLCWWGGDLHHPGPHEDGIGRTIYWEHFGFESAQHVIDWFYQDDDPAEELESLGLSVTVWETDQVRYGGRQLVFDRENAKLVRRMSPKDFYIDYLKELGINVD